MQFLPLFTSLLPLVLTSLRVHAQAPQCPPGTTAVERPQGTGRFVCEQVIITCPLDTRPYVDEKSNANSCCPKGQDLVIYDKETLVGVCCGADQSYTGNPPKGKCCGKGEVLGSDGKCVKPSCSGCKSCGSQPDNVCRLQLACGDTTTNGLKFGSCYQVIFPNTDGKQLGREPENQNNIYIQEGHIQNIIYKICKTTADCGTGPVKPTDTFVIEDEVGAPQDDKSVKGWLNNAANGIAFTTAAAQAGQFKGTTSCSGCSCVVSLTGVNRGVGYMGDAAQPQINFYTNPKVALDMQFAEVPCDDVFTFPSQE
ncbi:hypothetical protein Moror_17821 [Moniliophthora roreri MCA 2997]|uniref:Cysteine-rich secreted protein n=1 Tax=Moniliophthora roreri (strain MCA 2997) TaxID=1381753 RepID=V2XXW5_MONRO|nr:hypothetical protein Moror_17821 [Moniliophthora roreri MCA 2997]KAI3618874.1 hypothetical protein WG66_000438 [Moniliophthora roreri]